MEEQKEENEIKWDEMGQHFQFPLTYPSKTIEFTKHNVNIKILKQTIMIFE